MTLVVKNRLPDPDFPLMGQGSRLYILARTDIAQMNTGKGWAHGGHAGTQFMADVLNKNEEELNTQMKAWLDQGGGGFGTKITLALLEQEVIETVARMRDFGLQANTVIDPTYPMVNFFKVPFTRSELTCGYVFCPTSTPAAVLEDLRQFDLHP